MPGSKTMAGNRTVHVGTWESRVAPDGSLQQAEEARKRYAAWQSDQSIVVLNQGNACGAKGLAGRPRNGDTSSVLETDTGS